MDNYLNHHCQPGRCDEYFCHLSEWCSPQPLSAYEVALMGVNYLAGWLQDEPRSTSQVAEVIFLSMSNNQLGPEDDCFRAAGQALFDSGFTPNDPLADDQIWH